MIVAFFNRYDKISKELNENIELDNDDDDFYTGNNPDTPVKIEKEDSTGHSGKKTKNKTDEKAIDSQVKSMLKM